MRLPWKSQEIHDIIVPRVPYLINLPTIIWHERDMYAVCVRHNSQKSLKKAARILGYYFRRENSYDYPPYELEDHIDDNLQLVLILKQQYRDSYYAMGCVEFAHEQRYENIPEGWLISWAWMHPYCRGKGYISKLYPHLLERYGDFYYQFPLSKPMLHVVTTHGSDNQRDLLREVGYNTDGKTETPY